MMIHFFESKLLSLADYGNEAGSAGFTLSFRLCFSWLSCVAV